MARQKAKAPSLRYHISGQSVVTINQRDYYLGPHDSAESIARYAVLMAVYQAGGLSLPADVKLESLNERVGVVIGSVSALTMAQRTSPNSRAVCRDIRHFWA